LSNYVNSYKNSTSGIKTYNFDYILPIVLQPKEQKLIYFDKTIITNIPAKCIIFGDPNLYLHGITSDINIIESNNSYLCVTIANFTNKKLIIKPYTINVNVTIVMSYNIKNKIII
jgi:hypothetical protein